MPIILCSGRNRQGEVAPELAAKGYCSTKSLYYYGVKLHLLAHRREHSIPFPEAYCVTSASEGPSSSEILPTDYTISVFLAIKSTKINHFITKNNKHNK